MWGQAGESANGKRHRMGGVLVCSLYFYCSELGGVNRQVSSLAWFLIPGLETTPLGRSLGCLVEVDLDGWFKRYVRNLRAP